MSDRRIGDGVCRHLFQPLEGRSVVHAGLLQHSVPGRTLDFSGKVDDVHAFNLLFSTLARLTGTVLCPASSTFAEGHDAELVPRGVIETICQTERAHGEDSLGGSGLVHRQGREERDRSQSETDIISATADLSHCFDGHGNVASSWKDDIASNNMVATPRDVDEA